MYPCTRSSHAKNILTFPQRIRPTVQSSYCVQLKIQSLWLLSGLCGSLGVTPLIVLCDFGFVLGKALFWSIVLSEYT